MRVRPFVPRAICARDFNRGDFLHPVAWDHLCPKRTTLPENNFYCGEVILPTCSCFAPFLICLLLSMYISIQLVLFCLLVGSFSFLFQMCSSQGCGANSLLHSRIICSYELAASRKQCLHQKRKAPFVLSWLILSPGSFGLSLTAFATCLPIRFMLRPTYSAWFWSKFSFSCSLLYRLGSTLGRSVEGFSSHRFFNESSKIDQFRDGACVAIVWSNQQGVLAIHSWSLVEWKC